MSSSIENEIEESSNEDSKTGLDERLNKGIKAIILWLAVLILTALFIIGILMFLATYFGMYLPS